MLSKEQAVSLCAVGPVARASGVARDVRKEDPYAVYDELDFELCTADSCDVLGRVVVRVKELLQSYRMIEQMVKGLPDGDIVAKAPRKAKPGEVVSRYEAPRGENIHYIKANGTDKPERLKVRAPTLANYPATVVMLRKGFIADIPLIFAAIDPCICCAERTVTLVSAGSGEESIVRMSDLRRLALAQSKNAPVKGNAVWPF
jgi:NADH-quinone oxidoreductase subunit D